MSSPFFKKDRCYFYVIYGLQRYTLIGNISLSYIAHEGKKSTFKCASNDTKIVCTIYNFLVKH
jgi:hypothetical protein